MCYILVAGSSDNVCADDFAGPYPLSEFEARALVEFVSTYPKPINVYISFHSEGQLLMFPYGFSETVLVENYDQLVSL